MKMINAIKKAPLTNVACHLTRRQPNGHLYFVPRSFQPSSSDISISQVHYSHRFS